MGAALGGSVVVVPDASEISTEPEEVVELDTMAIEDVTESSEQQQQQQQGKVCVLVSGSEDLQLLLSSAIVLALRQEGLATASVSVSAVGEVSALPYAAHNVGQAFDVVVAAGVVTHDPLGALTQAISASLLHLGVSGRVSDYSVIIIVVVILLLLLLLLL